MAVPRANALLSGEQLMQYAFNIYGWAMKIPEGVDLQAATVLNAHKLTTKMWFEKVSAMQDEGENPWRDSMELTPQERPSEEGQADVFRYVLVGFTYSGLERKHSEMHPGQKKHTAVGTSINEDRLVRGRDSKLPFMVVTPIYEAKKLHTRLFCLVRDEGGLCCPYRIGKSETFYLHMYRDMTGGVVERGFAWNQHVQDQVIRCFNDTKRVLVEREVEKVERDSPSVILEAGKSMQAEAINLIECLTQTSEPWFFEALKTVLRRAEENKNYQPPPSYVTLRKFADNEELMWSDEDSTQMAKEFQEHWPDTEEIDPGDIKLLKHDLVRSGVVVEHWLLRPFILEAVYRIKLQGERQAGEESACALPALETVKRVLGAVHLATPIPIQDEDGLRLAVKAAVKNITKASEKI
ncbi:hypothetical protein NKR23_g6389 [Pleurostoma richardsiae]|uniref:Uncharacterized protein n=1 Tax=Pleurostoma richardsiae TaxID=41990 RepID=A0AA38RE52_9PEZI|nr:hypothetical protein NKR23_g6389 [Pleurostoma richardsiae]